MAERGLQAVIRLLGTERMCVMNRNGDVGRGETKGTSASKTEHSAIRWACGPGTQQRRIWGRKLRICIYKRRS